jgi:two-component system response regulator FixJ
MNSEATVYVVDEDLAARESVLALVTQKGLRAKGFGSAEEFLSQYDPTETGCAVVDVRPSGPGGLDLLRELNARNALLPVVVVSGQADVALAVQAMQAGATTLLEKPYDEEQLWQAIQHALQVEQTQYACRKERVEIEGRLATLTADEREVFRRLLQGHANKRIASDLDIGLRTVELRRSNIMKKMQATSLPDLVRMAILIELL